MMPRPLVSSFGSRDAKNDTSPSATTSSTPALWMDLDLDTSSRNVQPPDKRNNLNFLSFFVTLILSSLTHNFPPQPSESLPTSWPQWPNTTRSNHTEPRLQHKISSSSLHLTDLYRDIRHLPKRLMVALGRLPTLVRRRTPLGAGVVVVMGGSGLQLWEWE